MEYTLTDIRLIFLPSFPHLGEFPVVDGPECGPVEPVVLDALQDSGGRRVEIELSPEVVPGAQHSARLEEAVGGLADVGPGAQV